VVVQRAGLYDASVTWNRREVLATLGVGAAHALLGCARSQSPVARPSVDPGEVRTWLRDAVARLHAAGFTHAQALAVTRWRTSVALDVLGAGVSRSRADGVVLTTGTAEQVTSDLSRAGVLAAAKALAGKLPAAGKLDFGPPARSVAEPRVLADHELLDRVTKLAARDQDLSSRIVYSAALIELDDAHVWAIGPGHDREQRMQRVRKVLTRVAWNGTRPIVSEQMRAWAGGIDALDLTDADVTAARENALLLTTPTAFPDGEHPVALEPSVVAVLVDASVRALLTSSAARRPEIARSVARGRSLAAPVLTLVDDPASAGAYGGFVFDDRGTPAATTALLDRGQIAGMLAPRRRPGHLGRLEPAPSHLRLAPGTAAREGLLTDGFELEGGASATVDPASERVIVAAARAYELKGGTRTGRVYADIELVGELAPLLASVTAATATTASFGMRDEIDHRPCFRSIEVPWLRARAALRARRRPS
jgi:predicted Zn-dependent protease